MHARWILCRVHILAILWTQGGGVESCLGSDIFQTGDNVPGSPSQAEGHALQLRKCKVLDPSGGHIILPLDAKDERLNIRTLCTHDGYTSIGVFRAAP